MKTKNVFGFLAVLMIVLMLVGCAPSEAEMQEALSATLTAMPTATTAPTATPLPTSTPLPTPTPEPTLAAIPGVDEYVFYDGVNMLIMSAYFQDSFLFMGQTYYPSTDNAQFLIVDMNGFGEMDNIDAWVDEQNVNKDVRVKDSLGNPPIIWTANMWDQSLNWVGFVFEVPYGITDYTLYFQEGTAVDLTPFLYGQ